MICFYGPISKGYGPISKGYCRYTLENLNNVYVYKLQLFPNAIKELISLQSLYSICSEIIFVTLSLHWIALLRPLSVMFYA